MYNTYTEKSMNQFNSIIWKLIFAVFNIILYYVDCMNLLSTIVYIESTNHNNNVYHLDIPKTILRNDQKERIMALQVFK